MKKAFNRIGTPLKKALKKDRNFLETGLKKGLGAPFKKALKKG